MRIKKNIIYVVEKTTLELKLLNQINCFINIFQVK